MPRPHWTTFAHGKRRPRGEMNATEQRYDAYLAGEEVLGKIVWHAFEAIRFRLADGATYCPDFAVLLPSGLIELREVKGFWAEAAKIRIKVAADLYPFRFVAVRAKRKKDGGGWEEQEF